MIKHFKTSKEIQSVIIAITEMMKKWGLGINDWMLGKNISLYYAGVLKNPFEVSRDITVHVIKKKLPWRVTKIGKSPVPPAKSSYFKDCLNIQKKLNIGIDFWPLPDAYMGISFINKNKKIIKVGDNKVNIETLEKYILLRYKISKIFKKSSKAKIKAFYYANKERYEERKDHYKKMLIIANRNYDYKTAAIINKVTNLYTELIKYAYPEVFSVKESKVEQLKGLVVCKNSKTIRGKIVLAEKLPKHINLKKGMIYVFDHFTPADNNFIYYAKAIITEGGGITCHAAIVSREFKVPCLVGVRGVNKNLKNGQSIEIDFENGIIKI